MSDLTHWKQNFNYRYTGAYEIPPGEERVLTISSLTREEVAGVSGKKEMCFVAYFSGSSKPMVLNKTNCKTIEKLYGPYVESWIGKSIAIESRKVSAFGDEVDALRVKKYAPQTDVIDLPKLENVLKACKTLDELKAVYKGFKPAEQAATIVTKDKMKEELSK